MHFSCRSTTNVKRRELTLTPPLTQESNAGSSERTAPFQDALKNHANRIKMEMTMDFNNRKVSKSQPGLHSMNENIVLLKKHEDVF